VFTEDNGCLPQFCKRVGEDVSLTSINFTPSIVRQTLRKLKPNSYSGGLDGISNFFLNKCSSSLCLPLCHIFDTSFKNSDVPIQWLSAIVVPIHKSEPTSDPNNYRLISLTSACCRAMERIIKILNYLLKYNLISHHQYGFIKRRSTCTNLLESLSDLTNHLKILVAQALTNMISQCRLYAFEQWQLSRVHAEVNISKFLDCISLIFRYTFKPAKAGRQPLQDQ